MAEPASGSARVTTAATSANLGPGFDTFGLALDWTDSCAASIVDGPSRARITGLGHDTLPCDERHLVVRAALAGLTELGVQVPGLEVVAHNTIPQGRGLGSSSSAIVAGLGLAWGLARGTAPLDRDWAVALATRIEGHPDNVAAAVLGGFAQAWTGADGVAGAVSGAVADDLSAVVYVPEEPVATEAARGLLPATVTHPDAAANTARAALLVTALAGRPELLHLATEDRLHQEYRRSAMRASYDLVCDLRAAGHAAVISGAGPTVLVLGTAAMLDRLEPRPGFVERRVGVGPGVRVDAAPSPV